MNDCLLSFSLLIFQAIFTELKNVLECLRKRPLFTAIHCHETWQLRYNAAGLPPESPSLQTMVTSVQVKVQQGGCFSTHHTYTLQPDDVGRTSNTADHPKCAVVSYLFAQIHSLICNIYYNIIM